MPTRHRTTRSLDRSRSPAGRQTLGEPTRPTTHRTLRNSTRLDRHYTYKSALQFSGRRRQHGTPASKQCRTSSRRTGAVRAARARIQRNDALVSGSASNVKPCARMSWPRIDVSDSNRFLVGSGRLGRSISSGRGSLSIVLSTAVWRAPGRGVSLCQCPAGISPA